MTLLIAGVILFFGIHGVSIVASGWRDAMAARMGEPMWKGLYSVISIAGVVLMSIGYGEARMNPTVLYTPPAGLRHVAMLALVAVFPILFSAYLPGFIKRITKHPMLTATKLWALAHLLVNGMAADVILFGAFLIWAVANRISMKRRVDRPLPAAPESRFNDIIAIVLGLAVYAGFVFWAHGALIGMPLIPR